MLLTPEPKLTKTDRRAAVRFGRGYRKRKLATTTLNKSKNDWYDWERYQKRHLFLNSKDYVIPQLLFTFFTKITLADFTELLREKYFSQVAIYNYLICIIFRKPSQCLASNHNSVIPSNSCMVAWSLTLVKFCPLWSLFILIHDFHAKLKLFY